MGEAIEEKKEYTYEEYLALEQVSEHRLEYHFGEIFALAGTSMRHNRIVFKSQACLDELLSGQDCEPFGMDMKTEIEPKGKYLYPDLLVACAPLDLRDDGKAMVRQPTLIMEVLSPSTESRDRNEKFKSYLNLPSLQYYLLVSQAEIYVELYARQAHDFWHYTAYSQREQNVPLPELGIELPLERIYAGTSV